MNYISPMANNVAWHMAVEKLLGIEVPPRCQYLRVIISELSRISDHLVCNGAAGLDTGAFTYFIYAFNPREQLYDIFEALCGARFTNSYTRVGGLMYDASPKAIEMIRDFCKGFPAVLDDLRRLLNRNRIFIDRTKGIGVLSREEAINRSCSGPVARASGVTRDLRKDEPYLSYRDFDFQVCCAREGDCFARYLVRLAEMEESLKIVEQAVENLPPGRSTWASTSARVLPGKRQVFSHHRRADLALRAGDEQSRLHRAREEVYAAVEAPNGELGFYIVGNGSQRAWRARCRPPSFIHFAVFPYLIRGHNLSDVVAVLGSLNVIAAELDR